MIFETFSLKLSTHRSQNHKNYTRKAFEQWHEPILKMSQMMVMGHSHRIVWDQIRLKRLWTVRDYSTNWLFSINQLHICKELQRVCCHFLTFILSTVSKILSKLKTEKNNSVLQEMSKIWLQGLLSTSDKGSLFTDHQSNLYFKVHFFVVELT